MFLSNDVVVYRPGRPIDTSKILRVQNLPSSQWGPIAEAYPEVEAAGSNASFHGKRNTTIFQPTQMLVGALRRIGASDDKGRTVYRRYLGSKLVGVLVHVHGKDGGYDSVHIYRLPPSQMKSPARERAR